MYLIFDFKDIKYTKIEEILGIKTKYYNVIKL